MSTGSTYLRLEVISGNATGDTIVVDDELVIGRHAEGAGRLSEDEEISRQHARISREATGDYAIEDLGSSNGTFINGLRIQSPRLLTLGDSIEAGATTLVVRAIVQPQPAEATPEATGPPAPDRHSPTVFASSPVIASSPPPPAAEPVPPRAPSPPAADQSTPPSTTVQSADQAPPLMLQLEVDFNAREARIALGENGETVRLVLEDGRWRAAPAGPDTTDR
jgi:pSer/pThr/pTyr-binding forkhead associated (FHA) protein